MTEFSRLPTSVKPTNYEIFLTINLDDFTYSGKQNVCIKVLKSTKFIVLNSLNIKIKTVSYNINGGKDIINAQSIEYNVPDEIVSITFSKEIPTGDLGYLSFEFDGIINEQLNGFYRSKYTSNGMTKYAAVTQFAPTDARRCFPCWDEPAIKATFDITLTIQEGYIAISNMPIKISKKSSENLTSISYEKTPIMSTYLVAFMVCNYGFLENLNDGKIIRVYAPKDKLDQSQFTLDTAMKCLPFYESYFNIPYPLSKIDLVAMAELSFGAMENWGLITFREAVILVDSNSSTDKKERAALTIAHELAHQWFGNLVTMEWWTHLWLNEGYAAFMETLCVDNLYPEFSIWSRFLTTKHIKALELDALVNTHPIEVPIKNPSEIAEIFDEISYNKGASVIRMIYNYIGDEDFKEGMKLYLKKHAYSNVQTADLWKSLEESSNKPIGSIMSTWTKMPGYPLVSVTEKNFKNSKNRILTISQKRFYFGSPNNTANTIWLIPISISSAENPEKVLKIVILDEITKDVEIEGISKQSWIKVNTGTVGFYRTMYSTDLFEKLISAVQEKSLPTFDRLGLLDDLFATAQSGHTSTVEYLRLLNEFKNESDYIIWSSIINSLRKINGILSHLEKIIHWFQAFGRNLLQGIQAKLGWSAKPNEHHLDTLLRTLVLSQLVEFADKAVIEEAKRLFELHITKQSILPADFRGLVYRAVLLNGSVGDFEKILSLYRDTDAHEEKNRILSSFGAIKDLNILQRILEFSMSEEVRAQDTIYALNSVASNHQGRLLAWQYFKSNLKLFVQRCQAGNLLTNIVGTVTIKFTSEEIVPDIKEFFEQNAVSGTERTVQQSIETIKLNAAWLNRDQESLNKFLENQFKAN
ncbi:puromycin-sensitive aminopeptidase-like [Copidosoma floridanum]|uniref:puromycin-sensitive aminopeptidase-like n=1 Tax=Copidosoma floridanum TaxID=29053 RepID=UPI0006C94668|nr:puromycin-sensitive aminopeptidase-like [Copidosoma floridanum]